VLGLQPVEHGGHAAGLLDGDDRQGDHADQDDEELHDLVVDRAGQAAEQDVGQHEQRRQHDRDDQRDAQQRLEHDGQRVQVDAGDEHAAQDERDRVDQVGLRVEPQPQVLRDAAHLGAVVEGHHHDAEEHHGRDRADPEIVHHCGPVLRAARRLPQQLDGADVRGYEADPGDPGRE
jgi:hypothetical protein